MVDLAFSLDVRAPARRRIEVSLECDRSVFGTTATEGLLFLPVWTPGSYLVREFARHLGPVVATDAATGAPLPCRKVGKNRYGVGLAPGARRIRLTYHVHAGELTVRTADVTADHAFWNHANVLLWPVGGRGLTAEVAVRAPAGWRVACTLPRRDGGDGPVFSAGDLDAAMDAPVLCGDLVELQWAAGGVAHRALLEGTGGVTPPAGMVSDLASITRCAIEVFGEVPYRDYTFLCLFADAGHGGLEHRDGSVLLAARTALRPGKAYQDLLGLAAHELFHAWNVTRMRPQELWVYDYEQENHTSMLWLAEGFTAYYDDLICLRAGVIDQGEYLETVARNVQNLLTGQGRRKQSLAAASHDAWIRFYRPDANTRNSTQNYYGNGAVAAMCLDLTIRAATGGRCCLDDAMRHLWQTTWKQGRGYERADVEASLQHAAGTDLGPLLASLVDGPLEPGLEPLLRQFGITIRQKENGKPYLGLGFQDGCTVVGFVNEDGPAFEAGIAAGDEVLALDGLRVTADSWTPVFQAVAAVGRSLQVLVSSRGVVRTRSLVPIANPGGPLALEPIRDCSGEAAGLRAGWLGSPKAGS